jgi:hypothetical protein
MQTTFAIRSAPKKKNSMKIAQYSTIGFVFGAALLGLSAGCVGYVDGPRGEVYAPAPSVYVEEGVPVQDDYVYYPAYQVYYSSYRHQYVYQSGRSWVSRPAPPHVSVDVLFSSPSVNVGFHDSPARHHAEIARQYPKQWRSPGANHDNHDNHDDHRGNDQRRN